MGFRRFWARRDPCVVQTAPIFLVTPYFFLYWSARLAGGCSKAPTASARARTASEGTPSETRGIHGRVQAILGRTLQKYVTENRENACDICITGG